MIPSDIQVVETRVTPDVVELDDQYHLHIN